jgi:anti-sigma factor RsiW
MAHDSYQLLISLSLDEQLSDEEQDALNQHMRTCALCTDIWVHMNSFDRLLSIQPQVPPTLDFTAKVMQRVQSYEARRRLRPWMLVVLTVLSLLSGISVAFPIALLVIGPQSIAARWPFFGTLLSALADGFNTVVAAATWSMNLLLDWFQFLITEPSALAVVITGLVLVSTYIGLRESLKSLRSSEVLDTQRA